ncbi:MAG: pentapeptide repeat-containing protein [Desulfobacterales bacterium]|nr:pentapeptide repeat-containing protein [Desulfobacterales bacterium]
MKVNMDISAGNYSNEDFSGKEITSKEYIGCTFMDCDFSSSIFNKCNLIDCSFLKCNLSNLKVNYSKFSGIVFEDGKLIGIDWTRAFWGDYQLDVPLKFYRCNVSDSSFFGLDLKEIVIEDCKAFDVDFRDGNFNKGEFTSTDFSNSLFGGTDISGADLTSAVNYNINIYNNKLKGAKFSKYEAVRLLDSLEIELI